MVFEPGISEAVATVTAGWSSIEVEAPVVVARFSDIEAVVSLVVAVAVVVVVVDVVGTDEFGIAAVEGLAFFLFDEVDFEPVPLALESGT